MIISFIIGLGIGFILGNETARDITIETFKTIGKFFEKIFKKIDKKTR